MVAVRDGLHQSTGCPAGTLPRSRASTSSPTVRIVVNKTYGSRYGASVSARNPSRRGDQRATTISSIGTVMPTPNTQKR